MRRIMITELHQALVDASNPELKALTAARSSREKERHFRFCIPGTVVAGEVKGDAVPASRIGEDLGKDLLTVWDLDKESYRRIAISSTAFFEVDGERVFVDHRVL